MSLYSRIVARNLKPGDIIADPYDRYHVTAVDCRSSTYMVKVSVRESARTIVFGPGDRIRIRKRDRR